jgi:hypothetical protein
MCAARAQEERGEEEAYGPLAERYHVIVLELELESDGKTRGKQSHNKQPETRSKVVRCPPSLLGGTTRITITRDL